MDDQTFNVKKIIIKKFHHINSLKMVKFLFNFSFFGKGCLQVEGANKH